MSTINSNYGANTVHIAKPGERLLPQREAAEVSGDQVTLGGTGMACAFVAGTVAQMLSVNPELSPSEVKSLLIESGGGPGTVVNAEKAVQSAIPASVDGANIAGVKPAQAKKKISEDVSLHGVGSMSLQGLYSKKPVAQLGFGFASFD